MANDNQEQNNTGLTIVEQQGLSNTVIGQSSQALRDILMNNIKKVQDDASYLPQAKEIRDQVSQMINLARVEVDMIREVRKVNR